MTKAAPASFPPRGTTAQIEAGTTFMPKFDGNGLIPAIVTDRASGAVLMFAFMNPEALAASLATGIAHFWSRSRAKLWRKGEESGNTLRIHEMRTDCDQDVVWLQVEVQGDGVACHTGAVSCFYRSIPLHQTSAGAPALLAVDTGPPKPS